MQEPSLYYLHSQSLIYGEVGYSALLEINVDIYACERFMNIIHKLAV